MLRDGRLSKEVDSRFSKFTSSMDMDTRLFLADIKLNKVHVSMLADEGIIKENESSKILEALDKIKKEGMDSLDLDPALEDIHMAIENKLIQIAGVVGKKMHTAKSRNDQIATDLRLVLKEEIAEIIDKLQNLQNSILDQAKKHIETLISGYTHLQQAQITTLAHHLLAYHSSYKRDIDRLKDSISRIDLSPLGSCAFAGTSYQINRKKVASDLGFSDILENTMDGVSTRDFILETNSALSILSTNLSKMVEDFIIWSSSEFGYLILPDEFSSTSSIMPQKKNPDLLELIRAKIGTILGHNQAAFIIASKLPQSYNRDLQQISYHLWEIIDISKDILTILPEFISRCKFSKEAMDKQIKRGYFFATDLADYLSKELNYPFREAHKIVGDLVKHIDKSRESIDLEDIQNYLKEKSIDINSKILNEILDPKSSIISKKTEGSPNFDKIKEYIKKNESKN